MTGLMWGAVLGLAVGWLVPPLSPGWWFCGALWLGHALVFTWLDVTRYSPHGRSE